VPAIDTHDHLWPFDRLPGYVETAEGKGMNLAGLWRNAQHPMAFAQPRFGHQVEVLEHVEAQSFLAAVIWPWPGRPVQIVDLVNVRRKAATVVVRITGRRPTPQEAGDRGVGPQDPGALLGDVA
jgi:hypothetical protein